MTVAHQTSLDITDGATCQGVCRRAWRSMTWRGAMLRWCLSGVSLQDEPWMACGLCFHELGRCPWA
eukprot:3711517-Alexandrium_andersonii.AAC.1